MRVQEFVDQAQRALDSALLEWFQENVIKIKFMTNPEGHDDWFKMLSKVKKFSVKMDLRDDYDSTAKSDEWDMWLVQELEINPILGKFSVEYIEDGFLDPEKLGGMIAAVVIAWLGEMMANGGTLLIRRPFGLSYWESPENGTITMLCTGRYGVEEE